MRDGTAKPTLNHNLPPSRIRRFVAVAVAVAGIGLTPLACDDGQHVEGRREALEQQRRQLLNQFAAAQNRVRHTQAQALEDPSVAPLRDRFYELLRDRMIDLDPRAEGWLDRAQELGTEIDALSGPQILQPGDEPASTEERAGVVQEFAELEQTLQPLQNRAMADPDVAAAFEALQDSVHAVMIRLNPNAEGALDQMRRTSAAVDSIDAELRAAGD